MNHVAGQGGEGSGRDETYDAIRAEFGYDEEADMQSACRLEHILGGGGKGRARRAYKILQERIRGRTVFVAGAGPSLHRSLGTIARHVDTCTLIAADTAVKPLIRSGIAPHVVTTDLDGDIGSHLEASRRGAVMVVHAHGDNMHVLHHAGSFAICMGTTQSAPVGEIRNFGGFTDGDRAVFLAERCGAGRIILFGMDFGRRIGRYSETAKDERAVKIRKLRRGKELMERHLAGSTGRLFTTSGAIKGFESVTYDGVERLLPLPRGGLRQNEFNSSRRPARP